MAHSLVYTYHLWHDRPQAYIGGKGNNPAKIDFGEDFLSQYKIVKYGVKSKDAEVDGNGLKMHNC